MKTTLIIGIALVIALFASVFGGIPAMYIGFLAFGIIAFQAYAGYHFEGKKSIPHAFIGPALLAAFLITSKSGIAGVFLIIWIGSIIYLGYKSEI